MAKDTKEKWLLIITDKDNEDVVFDNVSAKPSKYKSDGNVRIFMFYGTKERIDAMYAKLKSLNPEYPSRELFVLQIGKIWDKDKLDKVLEAAFGDKWEQYMIPPRRNNK